MMVNLIVITICHSTTYYIDYLIDVEIEIYHGDLYKNPAIRSLAMVIGCMLSGFLLARVSDSTASTKGKLNKLRMSISINFVFILAGAIPLLITVDKDDDYQRQIYLSFINVGIGASVVALYVTAKILVPHLHLFNVVLIMNLLGNIVLLLAPLTTHRFK